MRDLLRIEPNQRIDVDDFRALANDLARANATQVADTFLLRNETAILSGGAVTNPSGTLIEVTKPIGVLATRNGVSTEYGQITTEGPDSITIDVAGFANGTYSVWVRFEFQDAENESRAFWNPTGAGSEFSQQVSTRKVASWSARVALTQPGAEWTELARLAIPGLTITDRRDLYFEGSAASNYSTSGALSRDPDRAQFGATNLKDALASLRAAIADVKGRGLASWYDATIAGMTIGYDDLPDDNTLRVGENDTFYSELTADRLRISQGNNNLDLTTTTGTAELTYKGTDVLSFDSDFTTATLSIDAEISSNVTPSTDGTLLLGSATNRWNSVSAVVVNAGTIAPSGGGTTQIGTSINRYDRAWVESVNSSIDGHIGSSSNIFDTVHANNVVGSSRTLHQRLSAISAQATAGHVINSRGELELTQNGIIYAPIVIPFGEEIIAWNIFIRAPSGSTISVGVQGSYTSIPSGTPNATPQQVVWSSQTFSNVNDSGNRLSSPLLSHTYISNYRWYYLRIGPVSPTPTLPAGTRFAGGMIAYSTVDRTIDDR